MSLHEIALPLGWVVVFPLVLGAAVALGGGAMGGWCVRQGAVATGRRLVFAALIGGVAIGAAPWAVGGFAVAAEVIDSIGRDHPIRQFAAALVFGGVVAVVHAVPFALIGTAREAR